MINVRPLVPLLALALALACLGVAPPARAATRDVKVLVPDGDNLQYMAFWLAKGAGFFADEGVDVTIVVPTTPQEARAYFERGEANVAVLPPPVYLELMGARFPLVLVCNLLQNDPINLVVSGSVWTARKLSRDLPVRERLALLRGLKVGVAPHPPARLRAMFAAYGLDADHDIEMRIFHGKEQNDAFARGEVDALFAHTPYVEKALVDQGAQLLVNISGGEVPSLAGRQIHALVFTRAFAEGSPSTAAAMARAIARAETMLHADHAGAAAALTRSIAGAELRLVRPIVDLYAPAVPDTPVVTAEGFGPALLYFPTGRPAPSLAGLDLSTFVAPKFAREASAPRSSPAVTWAPAIAALIAALVFLLVLRRRAAARSATPPRAEV